MLLGDPPFTHRPAPGRDVVKLGTLELISAVAFDIGVFLLVCGALVTLVHHLARLVEEARRDEARLRPRRRDAVRHRRVPAARTATSSASCSASSLISQAAVLTLIASGLTRGAAPIYPLTERDVSDPLSQAMALTAIVIGLAVTALLLVLVLRVVAGVRSRARSTRSPRRRPSATPRSSARHAREHEDEEAAAR